MKMTAVLARNKRFAIGLNNKLPWEMNSDDALHFRQVTQGKVLVVGATTYQSLPKSVIDRNTFIVLTRSKDKAGILKHKLKDKDRILVVREDATNVDLLKTFEKLFPNESEFMVIGGAKIYNFFIDLCSEVYVSTLNNDIEGDCYFDYQFEDWGSVIILEKPEINIVIYYRD